MTKLKQECKCKRVMPQNDATVPAFDYTVNCPIHMKLKIPIRHIVDCDIYNFGLCDCKAGKSPNIKNKESQGFANVESGQKSSQHSNSDKKIEKLNWSFDNLTQEDYNNSFQDKINEIIERLNEK